MSVSVLTRFRLRLLSDAFRTAWKYGAGKRLRMRYLPPRKNQGIFGYSLQTKQKSLKLSKKSLQSEINTPTPDVPKSAQSAARLTLRTHSAGGAFYTNTVRRKATLCWYLQDSAQGGRVFQYVTPWRGRCNRNVHHQFTRLRAFFTNKGRVYRLKCYEVPEGSRQSKGINIANLLPISPDEK